MRITKIPIFGPRQRFVVLLALFITGSTACLEADTIDSCVPSVEQHARDGAVYFQQPAPGQLIQWGAYAYDSFVNENGHWQVHARVNGRSVDYKDQYYPPHASVSEADVVPGQVLEIDGTVRAGESIGSGYSFRGTVHGICRMQ